MYKSIGLLLQVSITHTTERQANHFQTLPDNLKFFLTSTSSKPNLSKESSSESLSENKLEQHVLLYNFITPTVHVYIEYM